MLTIAGGILLAVLVIYGVGFAVLAAFRQLFKEEKRAPQSEPAIYRQDRYPTPDPH